MSQSSQSEFSMIPCDQLFGRIEENLSSYLANGMLDVTRFYPEIRWLIQQLGLAVFERKEGIIMLENYKANLPCDFYLLDSAWLCDTGTTQINDNFQGKYVFYTERSCETVVQGQTCPAPNDVGYRVSSCPQENVLDKVTITEYVSGAPARTVNFANPVLLRLNNNKSIQTICNKKCRNLFSSSFYEISINKQGSDLIMFSNMKEATVYLKYWRYPLDEDTELPLIPDDPIILKTMEDHLTHWFLINLWINGDDANIENKIKYWEQKKINSLQEAKVYSKFPSFSTLVDYTKTVRRRWNSYDIQNLHY